ncbi:MULTISPECIES: type VI secretion system baseplate subunit TssG [unclassified Neisseria]|uniref:type VI secretion system baseplate subunit TssG n=1 Tax=unclassified Neisseria TaxID=2623750 RepID=UPI00266584C9|nr:MULTISPECIES: type VI secretion system baseplate subunit TssG [unclassified Neisseria]MDO1509202.1 type VI secretion system baseplate subunit TssG [Neisseria sp. MVDL19-042950]MDO1515519.1 type VI secretion system baseplate subunit TssG [Neisseria sp. MVDL18-041461]MDO1562878.1 type VI secretion system baseplate subunit TssG [Neisseria sp. MVDL20-010259]
MSKQKNDYRVVLETANLGLEDNKPVKSPSPWAVPRNNSNIQYRADDNDIFSTDFGKYISNHAGLINYFQFCRILEALLSHDPDSSLRDLVRFRRVKALSFPAGEIASVKREDISKLSSVRTTFLGLYGVDSVLPDYFLNDIATNKEGSDSLAAFLDIFNHRISELFYQAWRKYRYPFQFVSGGGDRLSISLLHLIGQLVERNGAGAQEKLLHPLLDSKILGLLSIFHQRTRTAEGVKSIVQYLSPNAEVKVSEFQTQWIYLSDKGKLGKGNLRLNNGSTVLGNRIKDNSHLIHIDIFPDTFESAQELLPNQLLYVKLINMLKVYLGYKTDAFIYLNLKKSWIPQTKLKSNQMLGINTGLGKGVQDKRIKIGNYSYSI